MGDLITETDTKWVTPWTGQEGVKEISSHYSEHSVMNYLLLEFFYLIFSDLSWLWITETTENKTEDKGRLLYLRGSIYF